MLFRLLSVVYNLTVLDFYRVLLATSPFLRKPGYFMSRKQAMVLSVFWLCLVALAIALPARAEGISAPVAMPAISPASTALRDVQLVNAAGPQALAQATPEQTTQVPIELAPVTLPERRAAAESFRDFQTGMLYKLPGRMFLYSSTENSLRLETNVYQQLHGHHADMIYRPLPNVTLGWALNPRTRVSANYFFLRDQYTRNDHQLSRNIQSVSVRADRDFPITQKTTATLGISDRLLFVSHSRWFNDILPSISVSRPVGYRGYIYGSVIGQLRWFDVFDTMQEGDVFYSLGGVYRRGPWILSADNTFITSFRKRRLAGPTNEMFVLTFEAARRIIPKVPLPIYAFVRAQPIFNIGANQVLGFAGFNFRLFGGLRIDVSKPAIFPVKLARL